MKFMHEDDAIAALLALLLIAFIAGYFAGTFMTQLTGGPL